METESLHKGNWVDLRVMRDPANGVGGYEYLHETRCDGLIVAALPYRRTAHGTHLYLRHEVTPSWGMDTAISAITGGVEGGDVIKTILHELYEEAGIDADTTRLISLGTCRGTKSSDTIYHLFGIDITHSELEAATGDGSELEAKAWMAWHVAPDSAVDPLVYVMYHRLFGVYED